MARRPGAKNVTAMTTAEPSRCPECGSTDRKVLSTAEQEFRGTVEGQPYTHIVRRRCKCKCGQQRIEKTYENR